MSISSFSCLDANVGFFFSWGFHPLIVSHDYFYTPSAPENGLNCAELFSSPAKTRHFHLPKIDGMTWEWQSSGSTWTSPRRVPGSWGLMVYQVPCWELRSSITCAKLCCWYCNYFHFTDEKMSSKGQITPKFSSLYVRQRSDSKPLPASNSTQYYWPYLCSAFRSLLSLVCFYIKFDFKFENSTILSLGHE